MGKAKKVKIGLFGLFRPESGFFRQNEVQFRNTFSKRSATGPRSDKADLLGSAPQHFTFVTNKVYFGTILTFITSNKRSNKEFAHLD